MSRPMLPDDLPGVGGKLGERVRTELLVAEGTKE